MPGKFISQKTLLLKRIVFNLHKYICKYGDDELGDDVAAQSVPDGEDDVDVDLGDNDVGD